MKAIQLRQKREKFEPRQSCKDVRNTETVFSWSLALPSRSLMVSWEPLGLTSQTPLRWCSEPGPFRFPAARAQSLTVRLQRIRRRLCPFREVSFYEPLHGDFVKILVSRESLSQLVFAQGFTQQLHEVFVFVQATRSLHRGLLVGFFAGELTVNLAQRHEKLLQVHRFNFAQVVVQWYWVLCKKRKRECWFRLRMLQVEQTGEWNGTVFDPNLN